MKVLSLFDGMSCGRIALDRLGIVVEDYFASEIDKYANKVSEANYPDVVRLGDITKWREWDLPKIDLVLAGSPCQGFSLAGKQGGTKALYNGEEIIVSDLDTYREIKLAGAEFLSQSHLFWEFIEVLGIVKESNPDVKFMLENTKMNKSNLDMISKTLGVESVVINSALISAQNRERHYWANFKIEQPEDKCIMLNDIISTDSEVIGAAMRGRYTMNGKTKQFIELRKDGKANALTTATKNSLCVEVGHVNEIKGLDIIKMVYSNEGKCPTLNTMSVGHREPKIAVDDIEFRKLTPLECERLQTVPEGYTSSVSNSQRYKMLGNGWTIDVIAHILGGLKNEQTN